MGTIQGLPYQAVLSIRDRVCSVPVHGWHSVSCSYYGAREHVGTAEVSVTKPRKGNLIKNAKIILR